MKKQLINWPQGTPPSPGAPRRQRHAVSLPTELVAQHAVPRVSRQMGVQQRGSDAVLADLQRTNTQVTERARSEEHTSELQSRGQLVCRLRLEKKKETIW